MIYIEKNNDFYETIYVPKSSSEVGSCIVFKNLINNNEYTFEISIENPHFYYLNIDQETKIKEGLYNYYVMNGERILESGLAQCGIFNRESISYNEKKEYKQYKG